MLAQLLALQLQLLGSPAPPPPLDLVPPLSLGERGREAALTGSVRLVVLAQGGAPDLAALPPELERPASERRPVRFGTVLGSSLGIVIADVGSMIPVLYGLLLCIGDVVSYGQSGGCDRATPFLVVGLVSFVFVPPAAGVIGARAAGEYGDAGGKAYVYALLVRLAALGLAATVQGQLGVLAVLGSELVLTPYVIGYTLAGAPLPGAEPWRAPAAGAVPVRDPGVVAGRGW